MLREIYSIHTTKVAGCGCSNCEDGLSDLSIAPGGKPDDTQLSQPFSTNGGKWGPSGTLGTTGGVVTWSLPGAGISDQTGSSLFSGLSVLLSSFLNFDYEAVLRSAFDAWSAVADIEFIQVEDDGGNIGVGTFADIRVTGGFMDGPSNTLAAAFLPSAGGTGSQSATNGDMNFDSGESGFWDADSFFLVAAHEIGHALGLNHDSTSATALMDPFYNASLTGLQSDDINGIQSVYGSYTGGPYTYVLDSSRSNLTLFDGADSLTVQANSLDNDIAGSDRAETIVGAGGADTIAGGAGADTLFGDAVTAQAASGISLGSGNYARPDAASGGGTSIATANDVSALFSLSSDADIGSSATVPHISISGTGDNTIHYYAVTINNAGAVITLDIDGTSNIDSFIEIRDAAGNRLAFNDDSSTGQGAAGSSSGLDSYLTFTTTAAGVYYLVVGEFASSTSNEAIAPGATYTLQVSVDGELASTGGADSVMGGTGDDTITGGDGNDTVDGGDDSDTFVVSGNQADYTVVVGISSVTITDNNTADGDDGTDTLTDVEFIQFADGTLDLSAPANTATLGDDSLTGTAGADTIDALAGNDTVDGLAGNDELTGGAGNDSLMGGADNDTLIGGADNDTLDGGDGHDWADYSATTANLNASLATGTASSTEAGTDTLIGIEAIAGGAGRDILRANNAGSEFSGNGGRDTLIGASGNDTLRGGDDSDTIFGRAGADEIYGGDGDDFLYIDADDTVIDAGAGFDRAIVEGDGDMTLDLAAASIEIINGGGGNDFFDASGSDGRLALRGGSGNDTLISGTGVSGATNLLLGGLGDDSLIGGAGNEFMMGQSGVDTISGGGGNDVIYATTDDASYDGGTGFDRLFMLGSADINLDMAATGFEQVSGGSGNDTLDGSGVAANQQINGNNGNDSLTSGAQNDAVFGGNGDDTLDAGGGNDVLFGNGGADRLSAGAGDDTIYFDADDTLIDGGAGFDRATVLGNDGVTLDVAAASLDIVAGGGGNDVLDATGAAARVSMNAKGGDDALTGSDFFDFLNGGADNDTLEGGAGNDQLFGGTGIDAVIVSGNQANYTLVNTGGTNYRLTDNVGTDGVDTLRDIETIIFADGTMDLNI